MEENFNNEEKPQGYSQYNRSGNGGGQGNGQGIKKPFYKPRPKMEVNDSFVFGVRPVEEAIKKGKTIEKVMMVKGQSNLEEIREECRRLNIPVSFVPEVKLDRMTPKNHQGIIAYVSPITYGVLDEIVAACFDEGKTPLILILDRITDVRNLGAIARTAECAGAHAIVLPTKESALITPDAVRTSSGALNHIPVCKEENLGKTIEYLQSMGLKIVACTEKAVDKLYQSDLTGPMAVVMGSEEDGISAHILKKADLLVKIPLEGKMESLNVSVATGIVLYEVLRQNYFI